MVGERMIEAPTLENWKDVDGALKEVTEAQLATDDVETELSRQINGVKAAATWEGKPHHDRVAELERNLKDFVEEHRSDLSKNKMQTLSFGEVGSRLLTLVPIPKVKEKVTEIIRRLKARQMTDCIIVEEKISKDALKRYGEGIVNAVEAAWKQKDAFDYEAYSEKLERTL